MLEDSELPESYWWELMLDTYATTQAIAVRRQADPHPDAASLRNLVEQVRDNPQRLTPERWLDLWGDQDDELERVIASRQWEENFGGEVVGHLDPAIPSADLGRLTDASASIKGYVDRHIAHAQWEAVPTAITLKVADLHAAIDVIGDVFRRYYSLLTASSMPDLVPVIQHDWTAIFRVPWDPQSSP